MSYRLGQRDLVTGVWKLEGSGKMPDNLASCFTEKIAHHEQRPSLLPIFFFFFCLLVVLHSLWDLSSWTRD